MAKDFAKAFYKSALWRDTREYILKRDRFKCVDCGLLATEVHHIKELTPDNINDEKVSVNPANLVSLCYDCHRKRHRKHNNSCGNDYVFDSNGNVLPRGYH